MPETVSAKICGVQVDGLTIMTAKFDGFDLHRKRWFKKGAKIAFITQNKLNEHQLDAIFGKGKKRYNVAVEWPVESNQPAAVQPKLPNDGSLPNRVTFTPSEFQVEVRGGVLEHQNHLLIEALAGSGKTTTLVWLVQELYDLGLTKGLSIIYLAFNVSIKEELSEKLQGTGVPAMTTHGFGFDMLKRRFPSLRSPKAVRAGKPYDLFQQVLCDDEGFKYSKEAFQAVRKTDQYKVRSAVIDLVSYSQNWGVFPIIDGHRVEFTDENRATMAMFFDMYNIEFDTDKFTQDEIVDYACRVLMKAIPVGGESLLEISYDDMLYLPIVLNLPVPKYDLVLTDESQDFNGCQILMLERLANAY